MYLLNAVVLPDFLSYLFQKNGHVDTATRNELLNRKQELYKTASDIEEKENKKIFCNKCGIEITKINQKFCSNCGEALR